MNTQVETVHARWRLEDPVAYRWIEALASLATADHILTTNNIFDIDALDVQDDLFPIDAADTRTAPLTIVGSAAKSIWQPATAGQVIGIPKPKRQTVTLQHHPLMSVNAPKPTPQGWRVSITRAAARQVAAYCLGRPSCEWSAVALVDTYWSRTSTASYVIRELFFCDAGQDAGAHSRIPAEWEMKLIDRLLKENRDDDIPRLIGHVHSHNSMGAFWSQQDVLMCGQRLDDMSAASNRQNGLVVSVVVANDLSARARMDWFLRREGQLVYGTFDPVPLTLAPPRLIAVKDVQNARTSLAAAPYYSANEWPPAYGSGFTSWEEDLEVESWYDRNRRSGMMP